MMLFLRKLHKWLGLVIGLQLILWAGSGVAFAWLDRDAVSAAGSVHAAEQAVLSPAVVKTEPLSWLDKYGQQDLYDIRAVSLADRWAWRVELRDRVELRAIEDGTLLK